MNFETLSNTFDLLVHNIRDNIVKVVRLNRNTESFINNQTLVHNYIQHFKTTLNEPLECLFTTEHTIDFYTVEDRTTPGYLWGESTKKQKILVYQIRCAEVLETYPPHIPPAPAPTPPPLVSENSTQYESDIPLYQPQHKKPMQTNVFTPEQKSQFLYELTSRFNTDKFGLGTNYKMGKSTTPFHGSFPKFNNTCLLD